MSIDLKTVRARLADIVEMIASLNAEAEEIRVAERVLLRLEATTKFAATWDKAINKGNSQSKLSQSELIIATLRSSAEPWFESTNHLRNAIKLIHGVEIKKSSLQPLVSIMTKEGIIRRDKHKIAFAERVKGDLETAQAAEQPAA